MTNLSIVLPTYNEKDNIIDLINKIKNVIQSLKQNTGVNFLALETTDTFLA